MVTWGVQTLIPGWCPGGSVIPTQHCLIPLLLFTFSAYPNFYQVMHISNAADETLKVWNNFTSRNYLLCKFIPIHWKIYTNWMQLKTLKIWNRFETPKNTHTHTHTHTHNLLCRFPISYIYWNCLQIECRSTPEIEIDLKPKTHSVSRRSVPSFSFEACVVRVW